MLIEAKDAELVGSAQDAVLVRADGGVRRVAFEVFVEVGSRLCPVRW